MRAGQSDTRRRRSANRVVCSAPADDRVERYLRRMSKISLIAKLTAAEGKSAELEAALHGVVEAAAEEDGLEVYSAHAADGEPGVYFFFELYRDQAAVDTHGTGERMRAAMGAFGGLLGGRPEITRLTPIAAKGLDIA